MSVVGKMCELNYGDCVQNALAEFEKWMDVVDPDQNNPIEVSSKYSIYCTAISRGDEIEWDFLWDRMVKTNNAHEKKNILSALGCSRQIWKLHVSFLMFSSEYWLGA